MAAAMSWGEVLRHPIASWLLDPMLLLAVTILCAEISPYLMGARRLPTGDLPGARPESIRPERLWVVAVGPEGVANAATAGLFPHRSHVIVTDRLLTALAPYEVRAVLAHEAAHIQRRHLPKMMAWFFLLYLAFRFATEQLQTVVPAIEWGRTSLPASICSFLLFLASSRWIARRFELDADRVGAEMLGPEGPAAPSSALDRIEAVNGPKRVIQLFGTHPSVAARRLALENLEVKHRCS